MSGVLLGPKTAEAAARFFNQPGLVHGPGLIRGRQPRIAANAIHVLTPSGGIPARTGTGTGPFTYGQAVCTIYREVETGGVMQGQATAETMTVYNDVPTAVGGNRYCQVKWIGGVPFIDVEPC